MGKRTAICFPLLLQVTFACPIICNCLFHIFGLSLLPNVVKETAMTMALTFELYQHRPQIAKPNFCALQWHHDRSPKVGRHPPTLQWHPAMAPSTGTTSTAPCNGTLVPRPIRQSGSSPSHPIGSKHPYSYRYLGKKHGA